MKSKNGKTKKFTEACRSLTGLFFILGLITLVLGRL